MLRVAELKGEVITSVLFLMFFSFLGEETGLIAYLPIPVTSLLNNLEQPCSLL